MLLTGRVAIVTGAGSPRGLGQATARLFAEHGAAVALLDRDISEAEARAREIAGATGRDAVALACDVTEDGECIAAVGLCGDMLGPADILVNIAGITSPQRLMEVDAATYARVMAVNMEGTLNMTQAVVPGMRTRGRGSIVNMSSVSAQRGGGVFGGSHYSAAKAAILGFTKACARELAGDGIRVNAVCPGFIDTDITAGMMTPEKRAEIAAAIPMGRAGRAEEVAGCCLFLASDLSAYCTGTEIDPNGGSHIH